MLDIVSSFPYTRNIIPDWNCCRNEKTDIFSVAMQRRKFTVLRFEEYKQYKTRDSKKCVIQKSVIQKSVRKYRLSEQEENYEDAKS